MCYNVLFSQLLVYHTSSSTTTCYSWQHGWWWLNLLRSRYSAHNFYKEWNLLLLLLFFYFKKRKEISYSYTTYVISTHTSGEIKMGFFYPTNMNPRFKWPFASISREIQSNISNRQIDWVMKAFKIETHKRWNLFRNLPFRMMLWLHFGEPMMGVKAVELIINRLKKYNIHFLFKSTYIVAKCIFLFDRWRKDICISKKNHAFYYSYNLHHHHHHHIFFTNFFHETTKVNVDFFRVCIFIMNGIAVCKQWSKTFGHFKSPFWPSVTFTFYLPYLSF